MTEDGKLVVLELFAGTRSIGKAFERKGHKVYSVDWDKSFDNIDLYADIGKLTKDDVIKLCGGIPDVIHGSPDCSSYSVAALGKHRKKNPITGNLEPQTEYARFCDEVNAHFVELIKELNPKLYFIENPRGGMRKMSFMQGLPRYTVTYCFSGDTKIITDRGHFALSELCDRSVKVLNRFGDYESAIIKNYGIDTLYKIVLSRCKKKKVIYTTANHLWWATKYNKSWKLFSSSELKPGMYLPYSIPKKQDIHIVPEYVCRGFVYGDGWVLANKPHAFCQFVEEKQEILQYFEGFGGKRWSDNKENLNIVKVYSLPHNWKCSIPEITDSPSNIFSWLAGYFAADGSCSATNGQVTLSSSKKEDLEKVRELAEVVGIGTYPVNECSRYGYGKEKSMLYQVTFMRKDIPDTFLLRKKHLDCFKKHKNTKFQSREWKIISVEPTDIKTSVYCCETEYSESFVLEDNIVTHNCKYTTDLPLEQRRMKPTDWFTNHPDPKFIPPCKNGDSCHVPAPRGARTGTQGLKGWKERSRIPDALCDHIVEICEEYFNEIK